MLVLVGGVGCGEATDEFDSHRYWSMAAPTRGEAEEALTKAVELAHGGEFEALCEEAADAQSQCEFFLGAEAESVPAQWPEVKCHVPQEAQESDGDVAPAGRVLVLEGLDADGEPYRSEMFARYTPDGAEVRLAVPLWWIDLGWTTGDGGRVSTEPRDPPDLCDHDDALSW